MISGLPLEKILKIALKNGGDFADVYFESTIQTQINADNGRIEKIISGNDSGAGIRVVYNGKSTLGYANELTESSLTEVAGSIAEAVKGDKHTRIIALEKVAPEKVFHIKTPPRDVPLDKKARLIMRANEIGWGYDEKVRQVSIAYKDSFKKIVIVNSDGIFVEDEKTDTILAVNIIVSDGTSIQTGYEPVGGYIGFELFEGDLAERITKTACRRAILMLGARPAPTGTMPVVLSSEAGGTMIHEAVGHGLEADLALNGYSVYQNLIGKDVASRLVTVVDDSTLPERRGSFSFDDEGVPSQKTILIDKGILKTYMHDRTTAAKAGISPTGNGRRESFRTRPIVRMTNTYIERGNDDPASILKDTHSGLYVRRMGGGQVNTITGDFVFDVQEGYLIKNGVATDPVRGATLTGNGPNILKTIDRVGNDLGFGIGTCGKDGQGVPVGHAQPTLRIPEIVVGGTI